MGGFLNKAMKLDPLGSAIHDAIFPGAQQPNTQARPWWGPTQPQGLPQGGWQQHSALPLPPPGQLPAGAVPTVAPPGAPPPMPGFTPPQIGPGGHVMAPSQAPPPSSPTPAQYAAGLAKPNPFQGAQTFLNGKPVSASTEATAAFGGH